MKGISSEWKCLIGVILVSAIILIYLGLMHIQPDSTPRATPYKCSPTAILPEHGSNLHFPHQSTI